MLSELLAILSKNMILISNFQLMVLEQNYHGQGMFSNMHQWNVRVGDRSKVDGQKGWNEFVLWAVHFDRSSSNLTWSIEQGDLWKLPLVDFCFNVNLTPNPNCNMIDGVLYAYRRSGSFLLKMVHVHGLIQYFWFQQFWSTILISRSLESDF